MISPAQKWPSVSQFSLSSLPSISQSQPPSWFGRDYSLLSSGWDSLGTIGVSRHPVEPITSWHQHACRHNHHHCPYITLTTTIIICSRVAKIANSKSHVIFKNFLRQSSSFPHSLPNVHQFDLQESVAIASGFWDLVLIISQMLQLIIITSKWNVRKSTLSGGGEWKTRGGQHQNMQMEWFELILESASTSPSSRQTPPFPSCSSPWPYSWPAWELAVKVVSLISAFQTFNQN